MHKPRDEVSGRQSWSAVLLPASLDDVCRVRGWARSLLLGQCADRIVDVLLIADELVTDAFDFGGAASEVRLRITGVGPHLLIEVDSTNLPAGGKYPQRATGFGRLLVEELTANWDVRRHDAVKTTWAVLDLSA